VLDPKHASVTARLTHFGLSNYTMRFDKIDAHYSYDPAHPEVSKIEVAIDANSLDVGDDIVSQQFARDFLNAQAHPKISFVSTAIHRTGANRGVMEGNLTLRGVTKPVALDVTYNGAASVMNVQYKMGFSASGEIKRSQFGSTGYLGPVGDDVHLTIEAEFIHK
jgi:polyisoprenoid-binding protein YceI